jgi:hypothetical protein
MTSAGARQPGTSMEGADGPVAHRRQFVIATRPLAFGPGWWSEPLPGGMVLSLHEDLHLERASFQGRDVTVLGRPVAFAAEGAFSPGARERDASLCDSRASRFAWLDWPFLRPDPGSVLPLLYGETPHGPIVTSSSALGRLAGAKHSLGRMIHRRGLNWTPPPGTVGGGLLKLLRDQKLHLPSLRVEVSPSPVTPLGSFDVARKSLVETLTTIMCGIGDRDGPVRMMLTGGLDSRTVLAAAVSSGIEFETVTMAFDTVKPADVEIAAQMSRYLGVRHTVSGAQPWEDSRLEVWRQHTAQSHSDAQDAFLVPENQYRFMDAGSTAVGGGCFELGRRFFRHRFEGLRLDTVTGEDLWRRSEARPPDPATVAYLDAWLAWRREHPDGLDLIDSYYLDQRIGGWASAVDQGLDIYAGEMVLPGNCTAVFSALITPGEKERAAGKLQRAAIADMVPGLARFPINPLSARGRLKVANVAAKRAVKGMLRWLLPG